MINDLEKRLNEISKQEISLAEEKTILLPTASDVVPLSPTSSRFARYWALGVSGPFSCWKYSNQSQADAQKRANERVFEIHKKFRREGKPPDSYSYTDQMLREPIIKEVHNAVISRNSYGCLILNTTDVMFVDIDFPEVKALGIIERFKRLFKDVPKRNFEAEIINHVEDWTSQHIGWGWRIYRTFAGVRLIATNDCFVPESTHVQDIFHGLGADPRYRVLCKVQKCFRARLTPKPWRCDVRRLEQRWPWTSEKEIKDFNSWDLDYQEEAKNFATCRLVKVMGNTTVHLAVLPIIELHDQLCRVGTNLPLA